MTPANPKDVALLLATRTHGNAKKRTPRKFTEFSTALSSVQRAKPSFTRDDLHHNTALRPAAFRRTFGRLPFSASFPQNLLAVYEDAYTGHYLPAEPWTEYLLTMDEAEAVYVACSGWSKATFRRAVTDRAIPCYRFGPKVLRFRPADLEQFITQTRKIIYD
jgi:hypothetical protein